MNRPVFVLLTATTCPACVNFKNRVWSNLKSELESRGRVQIIEIEVPDTRSKPDPNKYHKDLARFVGWFPTMSLYPADRWFDRKSDLIGIIKNGKIVPPSKDPETGKTIPEHVEMVGSVNLSKDDILKWVDYTLDNPEGFFKLANSSNKSEKVIENNKTELKNVIKNSEGKVMVPTRGHYARFEKSKVE